MASPPAARKTAYLRHGQPGGGASPTVAVGTGDHRLLPMRLCWMIPPPCPGRGRKYTVSAVCGSTAPSPS